MHRAYSQRKSLAPFAPPREIAFLALYGAPPELLARAAGIAAAQGVPADAALLGEGLVSEEFFYRALADRIGAPFHVGRAALDTTASPVRSLAAGVALLAPLAAPYRAIAAPRGPALARLLDAVETRGRIAGLAISSPKRLGAMIRRERGGEVARRAASVLALLDPSLCARGEIWPLQTLAAIAALAGLAALALAEPWVERAALSLSLWGVFSATLWLRGAAVVAADTAPPGPPLADADLPLYTIIVAMRREGAVIPKLVAALDRLDYPKAKLDIKFVIESGDRESFDALRSLRLPARYEVIVAPPGQPRTKPRALNMALDVARGDLLCVFDAEDEPAPDQLRLAARRFAADPRLDALQGKLTIGNWRDHWLSFMFAVEYAILFELVNPGLAALDLPLALGGTTNHFRTAILRRVGGWDAWNVTEDADLGLRLARFGARVRALGSETVEEAPNEFWNWFRQRMRWQKGWMQTLIVHTREPKRYFRELGFVRGAAGLTTIAGTVLTGLFGLPFLLEAVWRGVEEAAGEAPISRLADVYTYLLTLLGFQAVWLPGLVAMRRRGLPHPGRAALLIPVYYALIAAATWAALFELVARPFHWHKTTHGRTAARALVRAPAAAAAVETGASE